jgi:RNA polymerase sigma-70 factor (ECF subfamily)
MSRTKLPIATVLLSAAALIWSLPRSAPAEPAPASAKPEAATSDKESPAGAAAKNILVNPGFEEGDKSPKEWKEGASIDGVEYLWDRKQGKKGKASLALNKTANRFFPIAQWYQIVERKAGSKSLEVSAQVKAESASKAIIDVIFLDENSKMLSHEWASYIGAKEAGDKPATHDWKEYSGKVKIPPEARKIQIGLQIYGPGKVWFDEVHAEYVE